MPKIGKSHNFQRKQRPVHAYVHIIPFTQEHMRGSDTEASEKTRKLARTDIVTDLVIVKHG